VHVCALLSRSAVICEMVIPMLFERIKMTMMMMMIFKCRHQTVPQYLQELCVPVTASTRRHHLRSAARGDLQLLTCRTTSFGPRSFAACAPKLWNSLPPSLRDPTLTLTLFCSRLKTSFRFGLRARTRDCLGCIRAARYKWSHTYIHAYIHCRQT